MKLLKLLQSVSGQDSCYFFTCRMYQGCTTIFAFFTINENLMTKRSFIFGIFHEQKEKKKIMVINILLSFSVFSSHA